MEIEQIIIKYYPEGSKAHYYYKTHVEAVANLASKIIDNNPAVMVDRALVRRMALLHDIGICKTDAPDIGCFGDAPYLAHGYLGRDILEREGLYDIAPICERHTGTGITLQEIIDHRLPLPHRDMVPLTDEEVIVCFADKFFSKSAEDLTVPKPLAKIEKGLLRYGAHKVLIFKEWCARFGTLYIYE